MNSTNDIQNVYTQQLEYYKNKDNSLSLFLISVPERKRLLKKLGDTIKFYEHELKEALFLDFKKPHLETDLSEIYPILHEIKMHLAHVSQWAHPNQVRTPLSLIYSKSKIIREPKGMTLIIAPWNYPFQLALMPLIGAISAGNLVILKPSEHAPNISRLIKKIIESVFETKYVAVIEGDVSASQELLKLPFHHIFFTGSTRVGKIVMESAAKNLASVTLELGGKSPVIVDESANLKLAAERICWGKFVNAGQTCVAPDYVLIHESIYEKFLAEIKDTLRKFYGENENLKNQSSSYACLIHNAHFKFQEKLFTETIQEGAKLEWGGFYDATTRYFSPTVLGHVEWDSIIMKDEIFGPILPIISYKNLDDVLFKIRGKTKPLALYIFSKNKYNIEKILACTSSGGVCINQVALHLGNHHLPFGGVNHSGIGRYHGEFSFLEFSHERAFLEATRLSFLPFFFPPYTKLSYFMMRILRFLFS